MNCDNDVIASLLYSQPVKSDGERWKGDKGEEKKHELNQERVSK